jgi:hypothetical protein
VERTSLAVECLLIGVLGVIAALVTWASANPFCLDQRCRSLRWLCCFHGLMYVSHRYWIPMVMPLAGGFSHAAFPPSLPTAWESSTASKRRVRGIFSKIVFS